MEFNETNNAQHYKFIYMDCVYYVPLCMVQDFKNSVLDDRGVSIKTTQFASIIINEAGCVVKSRWPISDFIDGTFDLEVVKTAKIVKLNRDPDTLYIYI